MRRILLILLAVLSSLLLFGDLNIAPGFNYNMVGPAYAGETVGFFSDTLFVTNTGMTDDFTLHLETSEIPAGWNVMWCHEYEDALCHFPIYPWTFSFLTDTTINIDFTISYDSSPGMLDLHLFWVAGSIDDVVMDFTFRTEDYVHNNNSDIAPIIELSQNYPNPFNPETTITYSLSETANIDLSIFNIKGELVKDLLSSVMEEGEYSVTWNGRDNSDFEVPSGMYFYQMNASGKTITRKMILMK